jgi:hypothetical protein
MRITTRDRKGLRELVGGWILVAALLCGPSFAHGQKSTERYIPIGKSPGLSGKYTSLGLITDVNVRARTITIADTAGRKTVQITDTTSIWLDRSKLKKSNLTGRFTDLVKGRRVEAKYQQPPRGQVAEWVKVEVMEE